MARFWTHGKWTVIPGREHDFVTRWQELAEWTAASFEESSSAVLLRDTQQQNVFYSFGPWPDADAVQRWRESDGFAERIATIRGLLETFEPHSAVEEVHVGTSPV